MPRTPIIAGNWKMNTDAASARELAEGIRAAGVGDAQDVEVVLCPPFVYLPLVADVVKGTSIAVGAQDLYWEEKGAFTGEVSATMLKDFATHVIIGHSERRQFYCDTDVAVNRKTHAGLAAGLTVIMCVGETLDQREQGNAESVVSQQLTAGLSGLTASDLDRIIVAYEPVWAIGTGRTATPEQAQEMHAFIRRVFAERHSKEAGDALRILYGGSVKPDNVAGLMSQPDIDGALVGGASLKAESFAEIVNYKR